MAVDFYGTHSEPQFDGTKPPTSSAADMNAIVEFTVLVGNRYVGTQSTRTTLTGSQLWEGVEFYETDTKTHLLWIGGAWRAWNSDWITYTTSTNWGTSSNVFKFRYETGSIRVRGRSTLQTGFSIPGGTTPLVCTGTANIGDSAGFPLGTVAFHDQSAGMAYPGFVLAAGSANQVDLFAWSATGSSAVQQVESTSLPFTWAVGDYIDVDFLYAPA